MIEEIVHFCSDQLRLEGVFAYNEDASPAILLCSPHPNLGGDMENNIITSLARVSGEMGFSSLRFNYRGVGSSECHTKDIAQIFQYWEDTMSTENYLDAVNDTRSALHFLISQLGMANKIFIAGYSFGCLVGMRVGVENKNVTAFASVSTPFGRYNLDFLRRCHKEKLFIYSRNDFATTEEEILKGFEQIPAPKSIELIENSDHFYRKQEDLISKKICAFFQNIS
ncbi:MAG: hypothetical protein MRJ65_06450 [Candidatus Brocadiaceae bacterium]|nr:hypothetical protein [Candidatus Brocadiaceae bacterium]